MLARLISPDLEIDPDDPEARRCDLQGQRQANIASLITAAVASRFSSFILRASKLEYLPCHCGFLTVGKIAIALLLMMPSSNATLGQYALMVSGKIFEWDSDLRLPRSADVNPLFLFKDLSEKTDHILFRERAMVSFFG